jgi:excisionase family DNA binding protein
MKTPQESDLLVTLRVADLQRLIREEVRRAMAEGNLKPCSGESPDYFTIKEAAEFARISVSTVRQLIRRGKLPVRKVGRRVVIHRADLEAILQGNPTALN